MDVLEGIVLLDSLGDLKPGNRSPILVCGSHCGGNLALAQHVSNCHVKAVFLNNAGVGKNQAGIAGLPHYEAESVLACAVSHDSAEIGIAADTWESGVISHVNPQAQAAGIQIGDSVQAAVAKIIKDVIALSASGPKVSVPLNQAEDTGGDNKAALKPELKPELKQQSQMEIDGVTITVTDSITFLHKNNVGDIVVCGSHGGLSAGEYAQKHGVKAVFFNDAGIGKNNAGVKSLESLSEAGILACTVDCMSAEIFNGQDVLENGIITICNQLALAKNIKEKMSVKEAIQNI